VFFLLTRIINQEIMLCPERCCVKNTHKTYNGTLFKHFQIQRRARQNFEALFRFLKFEESTIIYKVFFFKMLCIDSHLSKTIIRRLCKTRNFVQYQRLSDFGTAASRMLSGFEDFEVVKMRILGKRTVL